MRLIARQIALQGLVAPFALSAVAMAVQGLLGLGAEPPADIVVPRVAIVGRGPGTTLNYSEFMRRIKGGRALPLVPAPDAAAVQRTRRKKRQRREEEALALAVLEIF